MMSPRLHSKMHMPYCIYIVLALAVSLFLVPVISVPVHHSPVSKRAQSPPTSSKKKSNSLPMDETTKVSKAGDSNVYCIDNRTSTASMTLNNLKKMINAVDLVFGTLPTHETYLTTDYGESIYHNHDAIQAYYRLFDTVGSSHLSIPSNIWMTQSPCLVCAKRLISEYGKPDSIKPTLHIASIYTGSSLLDTVDSMKCMAKMVHLNFTILPWNWTDFRDNIDHSDCINSIDSALQDSGFSDKQGILQSLIDFIHELSYNPEVISWCSL